MQNDTVGSFLCELKHDQALLPLMHLLFYYELQMDPVINQWARTRIDRLVARRGIAVWKSQLELNGLTV